MLHRQDLPPNGVSTTESIGPGADFDAVIGVTASLQPTPPSVSAEAAAIAALIARRDLEEPGASSTPLAHPVTAASAGANKFSPDIDYALSHTHCAGLRRRERRRLAELLQSAVRVDGTCRSLSDPVWRAPPPGARPYSLNPPDMWAAHPCPRTVFDGLEQHQCVISSRVERWRIIHMVHCAVCRRYSTELHGSPPPPSLSGAFREPWSVPSSPWSFSPECYIRELVADLFAGFDPTPVYDPAPRRMRNSTSVFDYWPSTLTYLEKMDACGAHSAGVWRPPDDVVISSVAVVVRPSDLRAHHLDASRPLPARSVQDLTGSGCNDAFDDWPFRQAGIDHAVSLIHPGSDCYCGSLDFSKYYPSLPAAPRLQRMLWFKDPRASTSWQGSGKPSPEWLAYRAAVRPEPRRPPYARSIGLPLGFCLAPAFATCVSAEITCFLNAIGIRAFLYVDDSFIVGRSAVDCEAAMDTAAVVFRWLGLRVAADKRLGPTRSLKFLGLILNLDDRTISIDQDRRAHVIEDLQRCLDTGSILTDELESLIGRLTFCATVMTGGQTFCHRLRGLFISASRAGRRSSSMSPDALLDITWWLTNLRDPTWDGSRIFYADLEIPSVTFKSDASGVYGFGYVHAGAVHFSTYSSSSAASEHIGAQELEACTHLCMEYGHLLTGMNVRAGVDNTSVVFAINKGTAACPSMMRCLRIIANCMIKHRFCLIAVHVSRKFNNLADLASRFSTLQEFRSSKALPPGVDLDVGLGSLTRCLHDSPLAKSPVYAVKLRLQPAAT